MAPLDSLAWAKLLQYELGNDHPQTLVRERVARTIGPTRAAELFPDLAGQMASYGGRTRESGLAGQPREPAPAPTPPSDGLGSNAWVVSGSRSASCGPVLACDIHLPLSFPSCPGILVGHNERIGWGLANIRARTMDLYLERLDRDEPARYEVEQGFAYFDTIEEQIQVRGQAAPETMTVRMSRHGPVVSDEPEYLATDGDPGEPGHVMALKPARHREPALTIRSSRRSRVTLRPSGRCVTRLVTRAVEV